jgi:PAS domain S-box-containing protein
MATRIPTNHYEAVIESTDDAILTKDRDARITSWNPAAERLYGHRTAEALGQSVSILIPSERRNEERDILDRVLAGDRVDHYETERVTKDGHRVYVSLTVSPIVDDDGDIIGASVIARDITEDRRAAERAERLQEVTIRLAREMRPDRAVRVLLDNVLPALGAAAGAVALRDGATGELELVGSAGYTEEGVGRFARMPVDSDLPITDVFRTGDPLWLVDSDELWVRYPDLPGDRSDFSSLAIVPLGVGGEPFGAVSLSFAEPHVFGLAERAFMVAMSAQAAHALERGRLFEAERRRLQQLAFIAEASELLVESLDVDPTLRRLASLAVPRLGDWCSIELRRDDGGLRNVAVAHSDPNQVALAEELQKRYPPDDDAATGAPNVVRTGKSELYPEIPDELLAEAIVDDEHLRMIRELGMVSAMIVPLTARGRTLGAMTLVTAESGQRYTENDLAVAEELARHAALAVDNAMLYRREHDAAITLQRALLPQRIPAPKTAEIAVRYQPAGGHVEVGGDWYDVVETDSGHVGVVIGDVAGRGLKAASIMGNIRTALRAYILDGHEPAAAVEALNALMEEFEEPAMATLVFVAIDPVARRVEYVRAGHPPPLLRDPRGEVHDLDDQGCPPVGVAARSGFFSRSLDLEPGSVLLLYTDGLVERRGEGIGVGLDRLRRMFAAAPEGVEECADAILDGIGDARLADDAALLALRFIGG